MNVAVAGQIWNRKEQKWKDQLFHALRVELQWVTWNETLTSFCVLHADNSISHLFQKAQLMCAPQVFVQRNVWATDGGVWTAGGDVWTTSGSWPAFDGCITCFWVSSVMVERSGIQKFEATYDWPIRGVSILVHFSGELGYIDLNLI